MEEAELSSDWLAGCGVFFLREEEEEEDDGAKAAAEETPPPPISAPCWSLPELQEVKLTSYIYLYVFITFYLQLGLDQ